MSRLLAPFLLLAGGLLVLSIGLGCQRAGRYEPRRPVAGAPGKKDEPTKGVPEQFAWQEAPGTAGQDVAIEFVTEKDSPLEWRKLPSYWNDPTVGAAAMIGLPGLPGVGVLPAGPPANVVKIKVPLGLPDPTAFIPVANPLTRRKWALGRRLFFDETILTAKGGLACATCHVPDFGYTDGKKVAAGDSFNTPTLINSVYNAHQFWDGRATYLEEVVQARLEDEANVGDGFRHAWSGVIQRLRQSEAYKQEFEAVFRTLPTQDAVGKALATYLRTFLAGNSVHDRARQKQREAKAGQLEANHYREALKPADLQDLNRGGAELDQVGAELLRGEQLFRGAGGCVGCHSPSNGTYSDNDFHNIGVNAEEIGSSLGMRGRIAVAPVGLKTAPLWGAYKTPTLRGLVRTAPYFHNGQADNLTAVVRFHVYPGPTGQRFNRFLDAKLSNLDGTHKNFGLSEGDLAVLVLFLRALNGDEVDAFVRARPASGVTR